ncbi:hypothetical protein HF324_13220 [Chitinophaga oryzae]|uniref:Uncharacterized protein n=1 Tax=Chitinophaga oryzae TaxID=2725414 RepID=A0ABX6LF91_9BACT|nr:hypothetical protein [Chitinophaga oryzae]QJB38773.1 hypothetical protein HF324_13220 [Chitinophaga oryzae]
MQSLNSHLFFNELGTLFYYLRKQGFQFPKVFPRYRNKPVLSEMSIMDLFTGWRDGDKLCFKILILLNRLLFDAQKNLDPDKFTIVDKAFCSFLKGKGKNVCGLVGQLITLNYMTSCESYNCICMEPPTGWSHNEVELVLEKPNTECRRFVTVSNLFLTIQVLKDRGNLTQFLRAEIAKPRFERTIGVKRNLDDIYTFVLWMEPSLLRYLMTYPTEERIPDDFPPSVRILSWRVRSASGMPPQISYGLSNYYKQVISP